jgi:hypothetical protein
MDSPNNVDSSIREIEKAFELGKKLVKGNKKKKVSSLAEQHDLSEEKVRKLLVLADEERGFTRAELDKQFHEFRETGKCLSLSHFIRSLAVNKKAQRMGALKKALEKGMSSHAFQDFITSKQPNSRGAGRRPKPTKVEDFNRFVGRMVWGWDRQLTANLKVNRFTRPEIEKVVKEMQMKMKMVILLSDYRVEKQKKKKSTLFGFG